MKHFILSAFTFLSLFVFLTATASADHEPIDTPAPQNPTPAPQNPTPAPQNPTPAPQNPALESSIESLIRRLDSGHFPTRESAQRELSTMLNNPAQHAAVMSAVNLQLNATSASTEQRARLELLKNTVTVNWETVMRTMRTAADRSPVIARTRTASTMLTQIISRDPRLLQLGEQETQEREALRSLVKPLRIQQSQVQEGGPEWRELENKIIRHTDDSAERSAPRNPARQARLSEIMLNAGGTMLPGFTMAGGNGEGRIRLGDHIYNAEFGRRDQNSVSLTPVVAGPNGTFVPENIVVRRSDVLSDQQVTGLGLDPRTFTPSFNFQLTHRRNKDESKFIVGGDQTDNTLYWSANFYETSARQLSEHLNTHRPAINAARLSLTN